MSLKPEAIKSHIVEVLKHSKKPMSKEALVRRVATDLANGEIEDSLIEETIEKMADRMLILATASGGYALNDNE